MASSYHFSSGMTLSFYLPQDLLFKATSGTLICYPMKRRSPPSRKLPLILNQWRKWTARRPSTLPNQGEALRKSVQLLNQLQPKRIDSLSLSEQPFDSTLLERSPLFKKSRRIFQAQGGTHLAALVSTPRTLSSPALLDMQITYSPTETESMPEAVLQHPHSIEE